MAENILGLLFVTSSSRGRNVFRYPPDPLSPHIRLSQPIYPTATFTASDILRDARRRITFPDEDHDGRSGRSGKRSSNASIRSSHRKASKLWGDQTSRNSAHELADSVHADDGNEVQDEEEEDSSSSSSSGEGPEYTGTTSSRTKRPVEERTRTDVRVTSGAMNGSLTFEVPRRETSQDRKKTDDDEDDAKDGPETFIESQYNYALSYPLDFLGDMLTPPPAARNRKFEICVDELVFIGHPVSVGADGKWGFPDEDQDVRPTARGRRKDVKSHLGTVMETREGTSPERDTSSTERRREAVARSKSRGADGGGPGTDKDNDAPPSLNMFNLVLIMDKPDPRPSTETSDSLAPMSAYDEVYREIVFKWTATAFALQVENNYIAKEAWEMTKMREKGINESIPIVECCRQIYEKSSLDRNLNHLFNAIQDLRTKPANPLYAHLPTTITVSLDDLPISMVLSPRVKESDESWTHWGEIDDISEVSSEDSEIQWEEPMPRNRELKVEPWQTLLLIEENAAEMAHEISNVLVGLGIGVDETDEASTVHQDSRRGSKEEATEAQMMRSLIEACDVTKP